MSPCRSRLPGTVPTWMADARVPGRLCLSSSSAPPPRLEMECVCVVWIRSLACLGGWQWSKREASSASALGPSPMSVGAQCHAWQLSIARYPASVLGCHSRCEMPPLFTINASLFVMWVLACLWLDSCECTKEPALRRPVWRPFRDAHSSGKASPIVANNLSRSQWPPPSLWLALGPDRIRALSSLIRSTRLGARRGAAAGPCVRSCVHVPRPFFEWYREGGVLDSRVGFELGWFGGWSGLENMLRIDCCVSDYILC